MDESKVFWVPITQLWLSHLWQNHDDNGNRHIRNDGDQITLMCYSAVTCGKSCSVLWEGGAVAGRDFVRNRRLRGGAAPTGAGGGVGSGGGVLRPRV